MVFQISNGKGLTHTGISNNKSKLIFGYMQGNASVHQRYVDIK